MLRVLSGTKGHYRSYLMRNSVDHVAGWMFVFIQLVYKCMFSMFLTYAGRILMSKEVPVHVATCQVMFRFVPCPDVLIRCAVE